MNFVKQLIFIGVFYAFSGPLGYAQNALSIQAQKGQAYDLFFLTRIPDTEAAFESYKEIIFPIGIKEFGYKPHGALKIRQTLQGGFQPEVLVFGAWPSMRKREGFLDIIEKRVPTFHNMRRSVWTIFDLAYYEVQKDFSIHFPSTTFNVASIYWLSHKKGKTFIKQWLQLLEANGGTVVGTFTDAQSPLGYYFRPDYFFFSTWPSEKDYRRFLDQVKKLDHTFINNVNEYQI